MDKIKRKQHQVFINTTPSATATYEQLGADLEELLIESNKNVESTQNILGESSVKITNGTETATVDPIYADKDTTLFTLLQGFIDDVSELDDLATDILEVKAWETPDGTQYPCYKENVYVEITSRGGDVTGYQIPFNLHLTGTKTLGAYDTSDGSFAAGTWAAGTFTPAV